MSTEYADRKVRDILTKAMGQAKVTEQAVRALIERDHDFVKSLVEPYLAGIIGHAVERARKSIGIKASPMPQKIIKKVPVLPPKPVSKKGMDALLGSLAQQFEKNSGSTDKPQSTTKASQKHVDAMKLLAKKTIEKNKN